MNYTDSDLETMLLDLESDTVERKESFRGDAPQKVREAVCAFANDLPNYRNPNLAEAMRVLGFVQRFGFGIQLARTEQRKNQQLPPEFEVDAHNVICRVYPRVEE